MISEIIYRVIVKKTGSKQPNGTYWAKEVLYCGVSLTDARIAYHTSEPSDFGGDYGNAARETVFQKMKDDTDGAGIFKTCACE
jgi:hypothetical protein